MDEAKDAATPGRPGGEAPRTARAPRAWERLAPGLLRLVRTRPRDVARDALAGLALSALVVPAGVAYAEASGVPGVRGLYASIGAMLAYAIFGPSRILVLGPDSGLLAIVLAVVAPLAASSVDRAADAASAMALCTGGVCIGAGLARAGFVTELLSKPIRYGYLNGIALTVVISQVPRWLGFASSGQDPLVQVVRSLREISSGHANPTSFAIGACVLAGIALLRRVRGVPAVLIAVVAATVAVLRFDLAARRGVAVLGEIPSGLPIPRLPGLDLEDLARVLVGGGAAAMIAFADTSVLSRAYASRLREPVDSNRELVGLGAANVAAGLLGGFPVSSSFTRTPVAEAAGSRSQWTGVFAAAAIALLVALAPGLLRDLPMPALAAVVIAAAASLVEVADLRRIWRVQRWEFWLSMACCAGVIVLGVLPGIAVAIAIAVVEFLWDGWRPHAAVLGRVDQLKGYHDVERHPQARRVPGLVLLRWDAPLFFANADAFVQRVLQAVRESPTPVQRVVVAAEPITSVDVTAADALGELAGALRDRGIELVFAELKDPVKDKLARFGLLETFGPGAFFPTLGAAVADHVAEHGVEWVDWQERKSAGD